MKSNIHVPWLTDFEKNENVLNPSFMAPLSSHEIIFKSFLIYV